MVFLPRHFRSTTITNPALVYEFLSKRNEQLYDISKTPMVWKYCQKINHLKKDRLLGVGAKSQVRGDMAYDLEEIAAKMAGEKGKARALVQAF